MYDRHPEFAEDLPALTQPQFHRRIADPGGTGGSGKGAQYRRSAPLCYGSTTLISEAAFPPNDPPYLGTLRPRVRDFLSLGAFLCRSGTGSVPQRPLGFKLPSGLWRSVRLHIRQGDLASGPAFGF